MLLHPAGLACSPASPLKMPCSAALTQAPHAQARQKEASEKAERLAEEADVDGSQMFAQQAEAFARQHDALHKQFQQPERTMSVCEVCGVFINSTDNDQRRAVSAAVLEQPLVFS